MTIRTRLAVFISAISFFCILLSSGVVLSRASGSLEQQSHESLRASNNAFRLFFEEYIRMNRRLVAYAAMNRDIIDSLTDSGSLMAFIAERAAADEIENFKKDNPQIRYFFIQREGEVLLGDSEPEPGYFSSPYIFKEDGNALIRIEYPMPDQPGTKAVILAELKHLVSERLRSIRMNEETHFFLVCPDSRALLLHSDRGKISTINTRLKRDDEFLAGTSEEGFNSYELDGSLRMAFVSPIDGIAFGVSMPYTLFELSRKSLFQLSLLTIVLISILSVLASLFASRFLTRHLRKIAASVRDISEHRYDRKIEIDEEDELAAVSRAINTMADQIRLHTDNLETLIDERTRQLQGAMQELKELSTTDDLTGLRNRKSFEEALEDEIARAERFGLPLGLIYFDLDHFKKVNDSHGHHQGDKVLIKTAGIMKKNIRCTDFAARWGGEEFVIIMPDTSKEGLLQAAEKLREEMENTRHAKVGAVTGSFGCTILRQNDDIESIVGRCDAALYQSKQNGRNRVSFL